LCPFLPDSPRLLIRKGKYEEACEVIAALEGNGATVESPSVKAQFNIIKDILDREHMTTYTWWQLLTGRGERSQKGCCPGQTNQIPNPSI